MVWTMADLTGRKGGGEVLKLAKMSSIRQKAWSEANENIYKPICHTLKTLGPRKTKVLSMRTIRP